MPPHPERAERQRCPVNGCESTIAMGKNKKYSRSMVYSHLCNCHRELGTRDRMLLLDKMFDDPDKVDIERFRTG